MAFLFLLACALPNLDFAEGDLSHWQGEGFSLSAGVASSAGGTAALLHRTFRVPADAAAIQFRAARRGDGAKTLDVVLEAPGRQYLPRLVRVGGKWERSDAIQAGEMRDYCWQLHEHAGKTVRLALVGCDLRCSGFTLLTRDDLNARHFDDAMRLVHERHGLPKARRFDSRHFLAYSNAGTLFTEDRLKDCERIHGAFFRHFRRKGFTLSEPDGKLMVAVFGTQKGFDAYLGQSLGPHVTGVYHTPTNRLVVYDYATNSSFLSAKKGADVAARRGANDLERHGRSVAFGRSLRDHRDDVNVSTVMHEVAHQLSFNAGLLNRSGDVPAWLAEGLAVYCESTASGAWQGIGEPNPSRAAALKGKSLALRTLVTDDDWLRKAALVEDVVAGYSASWLLFRLLIDERPKQLKAYLESIHARRGPEHRLADFAAAFGDVRKLERRYAEYVAEVVRREAR